MGAMRWLLGAESRFVGATGAVRNSAIVRWRYLIAHKPGREDWEDYLVEFWAEHRDVVLAWHAARGYEMPQLILGHERERAFQRQQREKRHARI
jgi:hypothetical protein